MKTWDCCHSCGKELKKSETEDWRSCLKCKSILFIFYLITILSIFYVWYLFLQGGQGTKELLGTIGLTFDVVGCLFLFHTLTDLLLIASNGWGGLSPSLQKKRFKNFKIKVIGTLFLVLGFALQGAAQLQN